MKKRSKEIIYILLQAIIMMAIGHYGKIYVEGYRDLKDGMYDDFKDFGIELKLFNDQLSKILIVEDDDVNKEKVFIDENIVGDFYRSNYDASKRSKGRSLDDYLFMYWHVNEVIYNILSDKTITLSEEKYLRSLYTYTDELIKEYNDIVKDVQSDFDFDNIRKLQKRIIPIYNDYSKKADTLLNTPAYSFLKEYEGDFQKRDFEEVKAYCEEIFSKLVKNQALKYDNQHEVNKDQYVLKTSLKTGLPTSYSELQREDVDYEVRYNKKTKQVVVKAVSYIVPSKKYTEEQIDNMANDTILKFNENAINYDKKIKYDEKGKIHYITYDYIEKVNDVYDEMKKIEMHIEGHGLVSQFEIMYPYNKAIILPRIGKEEIISKIDKAAEIKDISIIRNIEGRIEYAVHLKYGDTLYEAVFDGKTGNLTYYGREFGKDYRK